MEEKVYNEITDKISGRKFKKITRPYVEGMQICDGCLFDDSPRTSKEDRAVFDRMCHVQICPDNEKVFIEI
ncbi:MAG: hypothetical protein GY849_00700 [Deltaproteobacteria bacterium]|nr:hypothetical protein [Deltaproteobacteria bacterium]